MIDYGMFLAGPIAALFRNVAGWLENALEDHVISAYEWGELGATVVRTTILTLAAEFGLGLEPVAAAASALIADYIIKAIKAKRTLIS